jgi:hypothetical protein
MEEFKNITPERVLKLANLFGHKLFKVCVETSEKFEEAGLEPHLADTIVRSGLEGALASFLGSMLSRNRNEDDFKPQEIIPKIALKISNVVEQFVLENGGRALIIDIVDDPQEEKEP